MTGDPARGDILCGFVCGGLSASATVCKRRRPALWGCSKAHTGFGNLQNWGPHLQSSQRGQGTSVMTGIRAAGGGLSEVPAGHVPGVWEVASEGERVAWLGLVKWRLEPLGSLPITCSLPLTSAGHPEGPARATSLRLRLARLTARSLHPWLLQERALLNAHRLPCGSPESLLGQAA